MFLGAEVGAQLCTRWTAVSLCGIRPGFEDKKKLAFEER